jgi:hypothetical protein
MERQGATGKGNPPLPQSYSNSRTSAARRTISCTEIQIALAISIASAMPGLHLSKSGQMIISFSQKPIATAATRRGSQRLMLESALWIPLLAQGPHGMVKNLNPLSTKKFGSMPGGMKYMPAAMPCFAAVAAILSSAR